MKLPKFNVNQIISKVNQIGDRLGGVSARNYESTASAMRAANSMGLNKSQKISQSALGRMDRLARVERGRSTQTRVKAGIGTAAAGTAGFLGIHKYQQHQDEKIMKRINQLYGVK